MAIGLVAMPPFFKWLFRRIGLLHTVGHLLPGFKPVAVRGGPFKNWLVFRFIVQSTHSLLMKISIERCHRLTVTCECSHKLARTLKALYGDAQCPGLFRFFEP